MQPEKFERQPELSIPGKGMFISFLILGICAAVIPYLGIILGIVGIISALKTRKKMRIAGVSTGAATIGLIISIIGMIIGVIFTVFVTVLCASSVIIIS